MNNKMQPQERRHFLTAAIAIATGVAMLSLGAFATVFRFLFGERMNRDASEIDDQRLAILKNTLEESRLALERERVDSIFVSKLSDLDATAGKYFYDFQMKPALAFLDKNNLPLLISAKCTHLGCTVGSEVDDNGKILCPCHISYFDIYSGQPSPGSPAKAPLPHIAWIIKDNAGKIVASKSIDGTLQGSANLDDLSKYSVFVAKSSGNG